MSHVSAPSIAEMGPATKAVMSNKFLASHPRTKQETGGMIESGPWKTLLGGCTAYMPNIRMQYVYIYILYIIYIYCDIISC